MYLILWEIQLIGGTNVSILIHEKNERGLVKEVLNEVEK